MYKEIVKQTAEAFRERKSGFNNHLKVLEEAAELSEVLIKTITKPEGRKPPMEKIIEEMGDLKFRLDVLACTLGIDENVRERKNEKALEVQNFIETGEWKNK